LLIVSGGVGLLLIVADGVLAGVRLLVGVGVRVSEHRNNPTVHATVTLGLTVQLFVTKLHFVAEGTESKTQPERVIITSELPLLTRKSRKLPLNTLAEQLHEASAQRRPGQELPVLLHELLTKSRRESVELQTIKQLRFPFDLNEQNSIETPQSV
jgi:hypothetical protein